MSPSYQAVQFLGSISDDIERIPIIWSLAELDPGSSVVRKFVREHFEVYQRGTPVQRFAMYWLFEFLKVVPEQGAMATKNLIDAADAAHKRTDFSYFNDIGEVLIQVAPNDKRVLRFFQSRVNSGPEQFNVYSDSVVKRIEAMKKRKD